MSTYRSIVAKMFCMVVAGVTLVASPLAYVEDQKPALCRDDAMIVFDASAASTDSRAAVTPNALGQLSPDSGWQP